MSVTLQDMRRRLAADTVDYADVAALGPAVLPHLAELAAGPETVLACKAVYLASLIGGPDSTAIVAGAAGHEDPIVRIAAAAALRNLEWGAGQG
ncbi:hypothetical protein [Actinokineospora iranica]|uniref:HEAT repeat-containing protein n=1 Tax=Actinokineospora iranica TaxID=1271860 RepID=A0A1G6YP67_9PSEU|nr:hypothetical protein [Actinokineospora iranica]SDD91467.1 hypothetical protein SAMN05216174_12250 [Actinokineospora iranica]